VCLNSPNAKLLPMTKISGDGKGEGKTVIKGNLCIQGYLLSGYFFLAVRMGDSLWWGRSCLLLDQIQEGKGGAGEKSGQRTWRVCELSIDAFWREGKLEKQLRFLCGKTGRKPVFLTRKGGPLQRLCVCPARMDGGWPRSSEVKEKGKKESHDKGG